MTIEQIMRASAASLGITSDSLRAKCRPSSEARFMAYRIARMQTGMSYPQLGRVFGCHYSNVMYGEKRSRELCEIDPDYRAAFLNACDASKTIQAPMHQPIL